MLPSIDFVSPLKMPVIKAIRSSCKWLESIDMQRLSGGFHSDKSFSLPPIRKKSFNGKISVISSSGVDAVADIDTDEDLRSYCRRLLLDSPIRPYD